METIKHYVGPEGVALWYVYIQRLLSEGKQVLLIPKGSENYEPQPHISDNKPDYDILASKLGSSEYYDLVASI